MKKVLILTVFILSVLNTLQAQPVCVVGRTLCTGNTSGGTTAGGVTTIEADGTPTAQWPTLNFISGANMTISCVSNTGLMRSDCTFVSSGGGGGSSLFSALLTSTNTTAIMSCGTGCAMQPTGAGTITANIFTGTIDLSGGNVIGQLPASKGGTGANGILIGIPKMNATSPFTLAVSSDVTSLWTGTCNSGTFLRGDGSCQTPAGSGTVNSGTGTHLAYYSSTGSAVSDMGTEFVFSAVSHTMTLSSIAIFDARVGKWLPPQTTVASLPSAAANSGVEYTVTDGQTHTDCFSGGGSTYAFCVSNGANWISPVNRVDTVTMNLPVSTFSTGSSVVGSTATVNGAFITQNANTVLAGPTTGSPAVPNWRALVAADIPTITSVNGVSFPSSPSLHSVYVITASNTFTAKVVNTCGDATHAISFDQGTDTWGCQAITASATAGGSNGQIQWNNATALGGLADLTFDGTHTIALGASGILDLHAAATSAFKLPGGFSSGILKVTTTTGAVSSATIGTCGDSTHAVSYDGTNFGCQAISATATAGGSNTQLQYNNSGALGGITDFTWNGTHTLASGASGILDLHLAATSGVLLPGGLTTGLVTVVNSTGAIGSVAAPTGAIVGTTDVQTLTNKSISGSEINSGTVSATFGGTGADLHACTGFTRAGNPFTCGEITGDVLSVGGYTTIVVRVNGVNFGSPGSVLDKVLVGTFTTNMDYKAMPLCNSTNQALNYDTSTHSFSCQTISGGGGGGFGALGDTYLTGNGISTSFNPGWTLTSGLLQVFLNGQKQRPGGNDFSYTVGGSSVTFTTAPQNGDLIEVIQ